ncbi:MAG: hypothetical protein ACJ74Q_15960 [Pyrinomonadaceae bacterium]
MSAAAKKLKDESAGWWGALSTLLWFLSFCLLAFGLLSAVVRLFLPALLVIALAALSAFGAVTARRRGLRTPPPDET